MRRLTIILKFILIPVLAFSCTEPETRDQPGENGTVRPNTNSDWETYTLLIQYDEDEVTEYYRTEIFYDQYGRRTGALYSYPWAESLFYEETEYIYTGNTAEYEYVVNDPFYSEPHRYQYSVTFRDDWRNKTLETFYWADGSTEISRSEWEYDSKGRITEWRYYSSGVLYSGETEFEYNKDHYTYYSFHCDAHGNINGRTKYKVLTSASRGIKTVATYYAGDDPSGDHLRQELFYDNLGREVGKKEYDMHGNLLYESKDFVYNGKELAYYAYDYTVGSEGTNGESVESPTRTSPPESKYKTKYKKIFY